MPSSEAAAALRESLGRIYGPAIAVRYYNLSDPGIAADHAETIAELREDGLPFPAIFLDGALISAGSINLLRILAAVARAHRHGSQG